MTGRVRIALLLGVAAGALALPAVAWGHAALLRTVPLPSAVLNSSPPVVLLTYSEAVEPRFAVVSVSALEKELQAAIDKIKSGLQTQYTAQRTAYDRAGATEKKFSAVDKLGPEQQGEVRGLSFVQQAITEKLSTAARDIDRVRQRGLWNGVFDERSAAALEGAVLALKSVAPAPGEAAANEASPLAGTLLVSAAREDKAARLQLFGRIQSLQQEVLAAIDKARRHLDHWANLQEIISLVREAKKKIEDAPKEFHGEAEKDKK